MLGFSFHIIALIAFPALTGPSLQDEKVYTVSEVSIKPEPEKGLDNFQTRWSREGKYPEDALEEGIEGVVFIEFIVNKDGTISDSDVKSGIGYGCDEAALKAFREVSKEAWKPGMRRDQAVRVKMVLPYFFRIIKRRR